jgi:CHASE2 domain-containing sensor protein
MILVVVGFITQDNIWYGYAAAAWGIGLSPFIPLWLFNVFITIWIYNLLTNKKSVTPKI